MSSTFIVEYSSYGGNVTEGALPQIPGKVVCFTEYDSSTGRNHVLQNETRFFSILSDSAQHYNFDLTDSAGSTLTSGNRGKVPADQLFYQATRDAQGGVLYSQVNVKDA